MSEAGPHGGERVERVFTLLRPGARGLRVLQQSLVHVVADLLKVFTGLLHFTDVTGNAKKGTFF